MANPPTVLILSKDAVLRDLLCELLSCQRFEVVGAGDIEEAGVLCRSHRPGAILLDAVEDSDLAFALLDDPWTPLGDVQPAIVLLAGSGTDAEVREHGYVDRVLGAPFDTELVAEALRYHASGRARREMRSGVQLRAAVAQTFARKRRAQGE